MWPYTDTLNSSWQKYMHTYFVIFFDDNCKKYLQLFHNYNNLLEYYFCLETHYVWQSLHTPLTIFLETIYKSILSFLS